MVEMFLIYGTRPTESGDVRGYVSDLSNYKGTGSEFKMAILPEEDFKQNKELIRLVAFYSKRKASELKDKIQIRTDEEKPNTGACFIVKKEEMEPDVATSISSKGYIFKCDN
jgi:hypothetical protein